MLTVKTDGVSRSRNRVDTGRVENRLKNGYETGMVVLPSICIYPLYLYKTFKGGSDGDANVVSDSSSMGHCPHMRNCLTYSHHKIRRTLIYVYAYIAFRVAVSLYASSSQIRSGQFCNKFAAKVATESVPAMLVRSALSFRSPFTCSHSHSRSDPPPLITQLNRAWDRISCRTLVFASSATITNVTFLQDSSSTLRCAQHHISYKY
jgi:hypothetical protein